MEAKKSRSSYLTRSVLASSGSTYSLVTMLTVAALSTSFVTERVSADGLVPLHQPNLVTSNGNTNDEASEDVTSIEEFPTVGDTERLDDILDANNREETGSKNEDRSATSNVGDMSEHSVIVEETETPIQPVTAEDVDHFDLWDSVGLDATAANDPEKIALANFPISTAVTEIPIVVSPSVKELIVDFSGMTYYSKESGTLTEKDDRHDLFISYNDVAQAWHGEPYGYGTEIREIGFVVGDKKNPNGSVTLYIPVTKEQVTTFDKSSYTVTASNSEGLTITVSDWIVNTPPSVIVRNEKITASVNASVDLLANVTIMDKEDDNPETNAQSSLLSSITYENLLTKEKVAVTTGQETVRFSQPADYLVTIFVEDSDGQVFQSAYQLSVVGEVIPKAEPEIPVVMPVSPQNDLPINNEEPSTQPDSSPSDAQATKGDSSSDSVPSTVIVKPATEDSKVPQTTEDDKATTNTAQGKRPVGLEQTRVSRFSANSLVFGLRQTLMSLTSAQDFFDMIADLPLLSNDLGQSEKSSSDMLASKSSVETDTSKMDAKHHQLVLFDDTSEDILPIRHQKSPRTLLLHLLVTLFIIIYSLVGFYFLKKEE